MRKKNNNMKQVGQISNNIRTKIELEKWARRVLIEAMLAGFPFKTLSQGIGVSADKLQGFSCFGARVEDAELKLICNYLGDHDFPADKASDDYDAYYGTNSPVSQYKSRDTYRS